MTRTLASVFLLGFALSVPAAVHVSGLLFNNTDSVPVGLYREVNEGAYAALCLPTEVIETARSGGLDLHGKGCPNGSVPVLKPLYLASAERPVRLTAAGFSIAGKALLNTAPKPFSKTGTALDHYPFGEYRSGIWAISDYNPDSFDSRYFGPVRPDAIRYRAQPVWTW